MRIRRLVSEANEHPSAARCKSLPGVCRARLVPKAQCPQPLRKETIMTQSTSIRIVSSFRTGQCSSMFRRMLQGLVWPVAAIALLLCAVPGMHAQLTTADIVGTVTDATGAVIPNANVTVTNLDTHEQRALKTNAAGEYQVTLLPVGRYSVTVKVPELQDLHHHLPGRRGRRPRPQRRANGHRRRERRPSTSRPRRHCCRPTTPPSARPSPRRRCRICR